MNFNNSGNFELFLRHSNERNRLIMRKLTYLFAFLLANLLITNAFGQGTNCAGSDPFCTGTTETFPNSTSTASLGAINCCSTTPNPAWYFMELATSGNNTIEIEQTSTGGSGIDVDFVLFGPYPSLAAACASIPGGPVEDCSYSTAAIEYADITGGLAGEIYVLLLTNFADQPGTITFTDVGGSAQTDCSIVNPCDITGLTATPSACNPGTNTYSVSGNVTYIDPPATGTLTITSSCGGTQTYNAPFTSPDPFNFTGITANGAGCTVTATFSADPACTMSVNYTAPAPCTPVCDITGLTATPSACNPGTNTYSVSGNVTYVNPPASGTLTITSSCGGTQTYNAPFTSPDPFNFTGLTANGANCTITATFSADPTCNMTVNYVAPAPCTPACLITFMNANISAPTCGAVGGTYSVSGTINTTSAPASGTLTVTTTCGGSQVFNAPFAGSIAYNITGLNADGANCTVTAVYSAAPGCTQSIPYVAPTCPCNMDNMFVNIGACNTADNTFTVTVDLDFSSPPATGFLQVDVCGVTQTIPMPASSPQTFTFVGIPADGSNCVVDAFFTANPACGNSLNFTAPSDCSCPADAGTFTTNMSGDGNTNFVLCENDQVDITANGDHTYPNDLSDPFTAYNPGIWVLIYACPPTPGMDILADPCFLGVSPFTDDNGNMTDINDLLIINSFPAGTFTDNTVYYVPITMYDVTTGIYSLYPPPDLCFDLGAPIPVTYLPPITATGVENCAAGTATITVNGGHPEIFGTQFTASNLSPATASFVNTTCSDGGTIVISGLNNGDMYSFDITDQNGCPITFTDGPFVGPVTAVIGPAGPFCTADPASVVPTSIAGGTWTATCGACINAGSGSFNPATAGVGSHDVTYTPPGCSLPSTITIVVSDIAIISIDTTGTSCNGATDGTITINAPGATQFSIDGGATFQASNVFTVGAGTYNIEVQSPGGCSATGTATVNEPTVLAIGTGVISPETCFGSCDADVAALPSGGTSPYVVNWTGPVTGTGLGLTDICSGNYTATVTDDNGCTASANVLVTPATAISITSITVTNPTCNGFANGSITITGSPTVNQYSINGGATFQASGTFGSLPAGTYNIVVRDANGCLADSTATLVEPAAIGIAVSPDVTICIGQNTILTATGSGGTAPYTITWAPGTNLSSTTGSPVTADPINTITYNVSITDANGCPAANDAVTVTVNPPLQIQAFSDASICPGAVVPISANALGGDGNYTFTWTNDQDATTMNGSAQNVSPATTTVYTVQGSDGCGTPPISASVTITVFTLPPVTFDPVSADGCAPLTVLFTNFTANAASCLWDFGDGTTSNVCDPTHVYTTAGTYDVTLQVTTTDGCVVSSTVNNLVTVYPIPVADFIWSPNPTTIFYPDIQFTNLTIGGATYDWTFDTVGTSTLTNPMVTFPDYVGGIYNVCLETQSINQCYDSVCHYVVIQDEFLIYVPNAFTPDADGVNDVFIPILQGEDPLSYQLMIFNRWGELIFESNNKLIGWDGTHKNIKSKEDVYVWKIRAKKKSSGEKVERVGHVTLLR